MTNPFQITRAADLDDAQIGQLWVDPGNKLSERFHPASPLPMIILGGRGSGKTHLVRYHSYALQRQMHGTEAMRSHVKRAKYLGIVFRCTGLYASRFSKKRVPDAQWTDLFALHLELTLGQLLLSTAMQFVADIGAQNEFGEAELVDRLCELFNQPVELEIKTLSAFQVLLQRFQRELDHQVGMASFRRPLEPPITVRHGQLIFGIPQTLSAFIPSLEGVMFTFFIDEYEHFFADLQKHVNTLVRERVNPVTFKIGARPHGMHTYQTWGGNEELKRDSDYELLNLDAILREAELEYKTFATQLCLRRIRYSLGGWPQGWSEDNAEQRLHRSFETSLTPEQIVSERLKRKLGRRPWLDKLRESLLRDIDQVAVLGISSPTDIDTILERLQCDDPLVEKTSSFLLYRAWHDQKPLLAASVEIAASAAAYIADRSGDSEHAQRLKHFREDMRDQMLVDLNLDKQAGKNGLLNRYVGIETWISMSDGIIRNLITTLKAVYGWALFNGEDIYAPSGISLATQIRGIEEASAWFVSDAGVLEPDRGKLEAGLMRVAGLLSQLRFARKPPECSLCRFSVDLNGLAPEVKTMIQAAEMWSLLIRDQDRKNRNGGRDVAHYRINPLVAPGFYLPIAARGSIDLSPSECEAIFGSGDDYDYKGILRSRLNRCNPPFSRGSASERRRNPNVQTKSPEDELPLF